MRHFRIGRLAFAVALTAASVALTACTDPTPATSTPASEATLAVNPACPGDATPVGPSSAALTEALATVRPGETLALSETVYVGNFEIAVSGTAEAPITLCGSGASVLNGGSIGSGYALHLASVAHWRLEGFAVTNAAKGIVLDSSSHNVLTGVQVSQTGEEGVHLRAGSSDNILENSHVSATGLSTAQFGEGIYIGSAESNWCRYTACAPDTSDRNTIRGNTIAATTAEAIDAKEGTTGGRIQGNTLTFTDADTVESAINIKGNDWTLDGNTIESASDGIRIHAVVEGWGARNTVTGNTIASGPDSLGIEVVGDARALGNIIGCDNVSPSGATASMNVMCQ